MSTVITQNAIDSWHYPVSNENNEIREQDIKLNGPNNFCGKIVFGTPTASKKEIDTEQTYISVYVEEMDTINDLEMNTDNCYVCIDKEQVVIGAYNEKNFRWDGDWSNEVALLVHKQLFTTGIGVFVRILQFDDYSRVASSRATYKPKVRYTATDIVPIISDVSPQEGHIDERKEQVFSWSFALPETTGYVHQMPIEAGSEVEWKVAGSGTVHTLTDTAQGRITIPANTFPYGESIEWRLRVKTDDNVFSAWSSWFTFDTQDVPSVGEAQSPANQYLDAKSETVFRWEYSSPAGYPQGGFEAEAKYDTSPDTWVPLFSGTGEQQEYTLPADTLSGGGMSWRIRISNNRGTWCDWSEEVRNQVIAAPLKPIINAIDGSVARPTITWQSTQQLAFQVIVLSQDETTVLYDSDTINSKTALHKIPVFLENDRYIVKVRVMNGYAMWSKWGVVNAFIETDKPSEAKLIAAKMVNGIRLLISDVDESATSLIIYRSDVSGEYQPIKTLLPNERAWADYSCVGFASYFVRTVCGDVFSDSQRSAERPYIQHCAIASVSDLADMMAVKYRRGDYIAPNTEEVYGVTLVSFAGRRLPVADFADASSRLFSFDASFTSMEQFEQFRQIVQRKETVLYRDSKDRKIYGVIDNLPSTNVRKFTDITITIQEVDYCEVIDIA